MRNETIKAIFKHMELKIGDCFRVKITTASMAHYYHNFAITEIETFARKEELIYETIAALTSNAGHLG